MPLDLSQDCICSRLRKAARVVTNFYQAQLADSPLTIAQYSLLRHIQYSGRLTAVRLGARLKLDKATLSKNLVLLEKNGWVESSPGEDRRRKELSLTPAGAQVVEQATPGWRAAQGRLAQVLTPERLARLVEDLAALEALEG